MSKKKIELLVDELIMPLPWAKGTPTKFVFTKPVAPTSNVGGGAVNIPAQPKQQAQPSIPKKEEPKKEVVKVSIGKLGSKLKSSSISIKKTLEQKEKEAEEAVENTTATPFNFEQLMYHWNMFADKMKTEGKKSFHAALTKNKPVLKPNFIIEMMVDNKVQEENLIKEKPILLDYLKSQLNNYVLQVNATVTEQVKEVHLYTDKEKFKEMLKQNPDLLYLKEKFNLDFEF